jgi:hypothetical protein
MRRPLLPGKRREYYDALRAAAEKRTDRTLEGRELRRAVRAEMLEIEIERLPQPAFRRQRLRRSFGRRLPAHTAPIHDPYRTRTAVKAPRAVGVLTILGATSALIAPTAPK